MECFKFYCSKCLHEPDEYNVEEINDILYKIKETNNDIFTVQFNIYQKRIPLNYVTEIMYDYDCPLCSEYHNRIENEVSLICSNNNIYTWEQACANSFIIKNDDYLNDCKHYYIIYNCKNIEYRESLLHGHYNLVSEQQFLKNIKAGTLLEVNDSKCDGFQKLQNTILECSFKLAELDIYNGYVISDNHITKRAIK